MFFKQNWAYLLLIAMAILITFFWTRGCDQPKPPLPDNHKSDSIQHLSDSILKIKNDQIEAFNKKAVVDSLKTDSLNKHIANLEKFKAIITDSIKSLISQNRYYKSKLDTLGQLTTCGEIIDQVQVLFDSLDIEKAQNASLRNSYESQLSVRDAIINNLYSQLDSLKASFLALKADYEALVKADRKTIKKASFDALMTKIATIAGAILAIFAVLKK